ncbi:MAG: acyltransferase [Devosia sp.]
MSEPRHLDYLDALRGYAILGVIALHLSQHYPELPLPVQRFLTSGSEGVHLFFLVSAFTLMRSWTERRDGVGAFYLRRLFRLAPMWWLAILGWTIARMIVPALSGQSGPGGFDILLTATFVHGWSVSAYNDVVPGGWSIASEAMFYLIFPLLAVTLTSAARAVAFALAAAILVVALESVVSSWIIPFAPAKVKADYFFFWFPAQLPAFALGIAAFHAVRVSRPPRWVAEIAVAAGLVTVASLPALDRSGALLYGCAFALIAYGLAQGAGRYLVRRAIAWIGQRSYSAYFWHLAILPLTLPWPMPLPLRFALVLAATLALSHLTYHWVELPSISLGKRLLARLRRPAISGALPAAGSGP